VGGPEGQTARVEHEGGERRRHVSMSGSETTTAGHVAGVARSASAPPVAGWVDPFLPLSDALVCPCPRSP
jgi:hypothetical protein